MNDMAEEIKEVGVIISSLNEIQVDFAVPKNVRMQIQGIIGTLREEAELPIKVNKALNDLDNIANDINLQSYTRMQIWNVISVLEKL